MTSYLEVLGAAGPDSPPSLLLFFDSTRCIINAPEGLQRLLTQRSVRLSRVHELLLTRLSADSAGGLPGLCITLADIGVRRLRVCGPQGLRRLMDGVKLFSVRRGLELDCLELTDGDESRRGEEMTATAVLMGALSRRMTSQLPPPHSPHTLQPAQRSVSPGPCSSQQASSSSSSPYHSEDDLAIAQSLAASPAPPASPSSQPPQQQPPAASSLQPVAPYCVPHYVLSYILTLASTPGKFDPLRARALGLQPGPLYSRLKAGQAVEVEEEREEQTIQDDEDGQAAELKGEPGAAERRRRRTRTVQPHECVGPVRPGPVVAVIDLPWRRDGRRLHRWISRLSSNAAFAPYQQQSCVAPQQQMGVVVHLACLRALTHPLYLQWMRSFGSRTQHVFVNAELAVSSSAFVSSALLHRRLEAVSSSLFACDAAANEADPAAAAAASSLRLQQLGNHAAVKLPAVCMVGVSSLRFPLLPASSDCTPHSGLTVPLPPIDAAEQRDWESRVSRWQAERRSASPTPLPQHLSTSASSTSSLADQLQPARTALGFAPNSRVLHALSLLPSCLSPQLTFLGTGAAIPSKYRNVSGTFFHPGHPLPLSPPSATSAASLSGGLLLDCGEGSLGQCLRKWGGERTREALAGLRCVFISHMHADHHLGLPAIIAIHAEGERRRRRRQQLHGASSDAAEQKAQRLQVIGPRRLIAWLSLHWQSCYEENAGDWPEEAEEETADGQQHQQAGGATEEEGVIDDELLDFIDFHPSHLLCSSPLSLLAPPLSLSLSTFPVRHCPDAYGLSVQTATSAAPPLKLVYSGDTMPCQTLVDAAADCTVLLHEATFESGMEEEAKEKRHSTIAQAADAAIKARAQRLILTHFSQRYPKVAAVGGGGGADGEDAATAAVSHWMRDSCVLAYDLMTVEWSELYWLPALTPAIIALLAEEVRGEEEAGEQEEQKDGHELLDGRQQRKKLQKTRP